MSWSCWRCVKAAELWVDRQASISLGRWHEVCRVSQYAKVQAAESRLVHAGQVGQEFEKTINIKTVIWKRSRSRKYGGCE